MRTKIAVRGTLLRLQEPFLEQSLSQSIYNFNKDILSFQWLVSDGG
jgi:hypothetical protein